MFKEILTKSNKVLIIKDGKEIEGKVVLGYLNSLLENAYFSPSFVYASNDTIMNARNTGIWLEFAFNSSQKFNEYSFEKLLTCIKPKYNFLTFYRYYEGKYQGKCLNIELSTTTNEIFNLLTSYNK